MKKDARGFISLDTGEPYQPVRLTFQINNYDGLIAKLSILKCIKFKNTLSAWELVRRDEIKELRFLTEIPLISPIAPTILLSILSFLSKEILFADFESFERAYLVMPFLYKWFGQFAQLKHADFFNSLFDKKITNKKVFNDVFDNKVLQNNLKARQERIDLICMPFVMTYDKASQKALSTSIYSELQKPLPQTERYQFMLQGEQQEDDFQMLIFAYSLMLRELVARKHWQGENNYQLCNALKEIEELTTH